MTSSTPAWAATSASFGLIWPAKAWVSCAEIAESTCPHSGICGSDFATLRFWLNDGNHGCAAAFACQAEIRHGWPPACTILLICTSLELNQATNWAAASLFFE